MKNTPEEREAVQPYSHILVEDFGYPKEHLRTRPQYRVSAAPSDSKKSYPVDIAVFRSSDHSEDNLYLIVECKKPGLKDGIKQLQAYLSLSSAELGVWYNGVDAPAFVRKVIKNERIDFEVLDGMPEYGQRWQDIGKFRRCDLKPASNLKSVFRSIHNYLAANAVGITLDVSIAQQVINLIFCKIFDERYTKPNDVVTFRAGVDENADAVKSRVTSRFAEAKAEYDDVFSGDDEIILDAKSLRYVVNQLQRYALTDSNRDAVGEAFETFIGPALKGSQGQFFTPRNVVEMVIDMLDPTEKERIIDPACGSGGFLTSTLRHVFSRVDAKGAEMNWPQAEIDKAKTAAATRIHGIDKDGFLTKVAKSYMALLGDGRGGVFNENSLDLPGNWDGKTQAAVELGKYDVVVANPPYGKSLAIDSATLLTDYDLGHEWKSLEGEYVKQDKLVAKQAPQLLFIERILDLLRPGGRAGIVLLESIFGMPKYRYIVEYMTQRAAIKAVVTLPEDLFQPFTHAKTCVVILEKFATHQAPQDHSVFLCDVKWCGHDSRGNTTYRINADGDREVLDEIPLVAPLYRQGAGHEKS